MGLPLKPLIIFFLALSSLFLSSTAVPSSRSLQLTKKELPAAHEASSDLPYDHDHDVDDHQKSWGFLTVLDAEGRRMESIDDYGPTGSNTRHDPKPPGRP